MLSKNIGYYTTSAVHVTPILHSFPSPPVTNTHCGEFLWHSLRFCTCFPSIVPEAVNLFSPSSKDRPPFNEPLHLSCRQCMYLKIEPGGYPFLVLPQAFDHKRGSGYNFDLSAFPRR
ncbi:hypothetical protein TNCV_1180311 [Trichonephila clavipes]|nr:hypothetical protein TNCV_1180311 [Trichonephila clavipes]